MQTQEQRAQWLAAKGTGNTEKVVMTLEGETVSVLPLWVAVHQSLEGGLARCAELKLACCHAQVWPTVVSMAAA